MISVYSNGGCGKTQTGTNDNNAPHLNNAYTRNEYDSSAHLFLKTSSFPFEDREKHF